MTRATCILIAVLLAGCGAGEDDRRTTVAVSVVPQAWLVREIGGPDVRVVTLVGPGESPASYQPSDRQVSDVMRAKVYFRIGVAFENGKWLGAIERSDAIRIVDLRRGLTLRAMAEHDHGGHGPDCEHGGLDPHIWLAPGPLSTMADTVAETLADLDPDRADVYLSNRDRLKEEIERADARIREILAPVRGRRLYVFHPAWGYFCDAYGLEQTPIELEGKEPSDAELTELVRRAGEDGVRVIFVQPQITGRSAEAVAKAVGAEVRTLDPLAPDVLGNLEAAARAIAESMR